MKIFNRAPAYVLSILLNVLLVAKLAHYSLKPFAAEARSSQVSRDQLHQGVPRSLCLPSATTVTDSFHWSQLESTNFATYRDNLRRIGCPEETIRDLIESELRSAFAPHEPSQIARSYWMNNRVGERRYLADLRLAHIAARRVLTALELPLSKSSCCEIGEFASFSFLPPEKQVLLESIEAEFHRLSDERESGAGYVHPNLISNNLESLEERRDDAIRAALTPEEYFEVQLRVSPLAQRLRDMTIGFEPTEEEFRRIFLVEQQVDDVVNTGQGNNPDTWRTGQLRDILGEERAEAFLKSQDPVFHDSYHFVRHHNLPPETADVIYEVHRKVERDLANLEAGDNRDSQERAEAAESIRFRAAKTVEPHLGSLFSTFETSAGGWLRSNGP